MRSTQITFRMPQQKERQFLTEYLTDAWTRFDAHDDIESAYFWRFGNIANHEPPAELGDGTKVDSGGVILVMTGKPDPSAAIDAEREFWDRCQEAGLLENVEVTPWTDGPYENAREKMVDRFGERGGDLAYRLRPIIARTTIHLLREFEEDLPAVGEQSAKNPHPVGDWVLIHYLMKQNGHGWYDEIEACGKAIGNRARSLAGFYDEKEAQSALDQAIEDLKQVREELTASTSAESEA